MTAPAQLPRAADSARQRVERAESIKRVWEREQCPDAAAALRENPDLAADRAVALDLAYEEYCAREEAGETLDAEAFCAQFSFGASLRRLLTVHQFLDAHPDALGMPLAWPASGDPVGDFLVLRELGRGSFARVYLALETTAGDRPVVLKVSAAGSREADTLGPLAHPHLIPVLSCRAIGAWTVVAMPFVGTATLEDAIEAVWGDRSAPRAADVLLEAIGRGGQPDDPAFPGLPVPLFRAGTSYSDAVAAVAVGLFGAVAYLHERNVVHRDIKPSNVLFGPGGHPFLLDFNLASSCATDPWRLVGTLPYMAPEQLARFARPNEQPDGRPGDVFACGVLLFELLTGRHPFGARGAPAKARREDVAASLLAAQRAGHPSLAALNPKARRTVREAVERCLALDPDKRPTAAELVALLAPGETRRRLRVPVLLGAAALTLALTTVYAVSRSPVQPPGAITEPEQFPIAQAPPLPDTPFERGMFYYRHGEYGQAAIQFRTAAKANSDGRAYAYSAFCLSHGRDPAGAIGDADAAIELGYKTAPVYANRAYNWFQLGKFQEAKEDCDEALDRDKNLLPARYTRACAVLQLHFQAQAPVLRQALEDINLVATAGVLDPDVWVTAAQLYVLSSDGRPELLERAARAVLTAVRLGKDPKKIRSPVLKVLAKHPDYKTALSSPPGASPAASVPAHLANPFQ